MADPVGPPPMYEDIFATHDTEQGAGATSIEPSSQPFSSSNLFSAELEPEEEVVPGGLIFPDVPAVDDMDVMTGLFGAQSVAGGASLAGGRVKSSSNSTASPTEDTAPVSTFYAASHFCF